MSSKSTYVCQRDGLAVHLWRGDVWKHAAGGPVTSCGKPPIVVLRTDWQAEMDATMEAIRGRRNNGQHSD